MRDVLIQKAASLGISEVFMKTILDQAEKEYPKECCGVILRATPNGDRLRPCRNAQDDYHAKDPENFLRTAKTAFWIDPKELLILHKEMRERRESIAVIYHSHPDAGAYFSGEDKKMALFEGKPVYPGVKHLVISVKSGKADDFSLYYWDEKRGEFFLEG